MGHLMRDCRAPRKPSCGRGRSGDRGGARGGRGYAGRGNRGRGYEYRCDHKAIVVTVEEGSSGPTNFDVANFVHSTSGEANREETWIGVRRDGLWYLDQRRTNEAMCLILMASTSEEEAKVLLLHCRLGHISFEIMSKMFPIEFNRVDKHKLVCDACEYEKHTRTSYVSRGLRSMLPFMLIHSMFGPHPWFL